MDTIDIVLFLLCCHDYSFFLVIVNVTLWLYNSVHILCSHDTMLNTFYTVPIITFACVSLIMTAMVTMTLN